MLIPVRGGAHALTFTWSLAALLEAHGDPNRLFEEAWASLLTVMRDRWPDWPIEVWTRLDLPESGVGSSKSEMEGAQVSFAVSFAGEGPDNRHVATMVAFTAEAVARMVPLEANVELGAITEGWRPTWAIDDAVVVRLLATVESTEPSVYLLGHYAGQPALFAATLEAWPLAGAASGVVLAHADTAWAFES